MKKLTWITGILAGIMVILAALGSLCNAVYRISVDETFYHEQSRAAVMAAKGYKTEEEVTQYIGLDPEEQKKLAKEIRIFMLGEEPGYDLPYTLSADESRHMLDVRSLTLRARDISKTCMTLAAALAVVIAWTGAKLRRRILIKLTGALSAAAALLLAAMGVIRQIRSGGFAGAFVRMHEMLFTNDLWLMDPSEDILIRMMPQQLFEQALVTGAGMALRMLLVVCALLIVLDAMVGSMIRRHLNKEK